MDLFEIMADTVRLGGSDIFVVPGSPIVVKCMGRYINMNEKKLMPSDTEILMREIYEMSANRSLKELLETGDDDFSFSITGLGRFRCNAYRQRGSLAAVLRVVTLGLPDSEALGIPESVMSLYAKKKGMVLVTGPADSGKSTTVACILNRINHERMGHIITIENPIEYLHPHALSIVSQREVRSDTCSFSDAMHAALRQAPDVIMLSEMDDYATIQTAMTAAEMGHLVLSSLHTMGAVKTIDRLIDVFPENQQQHIRIQLSMVLEAIVSQQLIPTVDGRIVPAFEVMNVTSEVRSMIRDGRTNEINNVIRSSADEGMLLMDCEILNLYRVGTISRENALMFASNPETLLGML